MIRVYFILLLIPFVSTGSAMAQIYQGPAYGSVPSGAMVSTDSFTPEGPNAPAVAEQRVHHHPNAPLLPTPPNAPAPTGPEGSNYVIDPSLTAGILTPPPITIASFPGIPDAGTSIPPDPYMAAGPNHVMAVVNSSFRICDKAGNTLKTISANAWFNNVFPNNGAFDPKVQYDHFNSRWIMVWLQQDNPTKTANYLLSVSDDSNPLGTWYNWALPSNVNGSTIVNNGADYPGVGFDKDAIYITSNQFSFADSESQEVIQYVKLRIVPKAQLYANTAGEVFWTDFWDLRDANFTRVFGTRPARIFGVPSEYYLVSGASSEPGTYFTLYRLTDPLGPNPGVSAVTVPVVEYNSPPDADQLGGSTRLIDGGGANIRNEPAYMDSSIWVVHCVRSGDQGKYSSVRYVRINTLTNAATEDVAFGADGFWHIYSAIAVDKDKNVAITFTRTGLTQYAGAYMTWRLDSDSPGLRPSVTMQAGKANYVETFSGTRNRWGDYNGIALDPADQNNFWMFTEYAESPANTWGTWFYATRLVPFPGAHISTSTSSINLGSIEVGLTSDTVLATVYNSGASTLSFTSISNTQAPFKVLGALPMPPPLATFDSMQFKVVFQPAAYGVVNDTIAIATNDLSTPTVKITLRGKGVIIGRALGGVMYAASASQPVSQLYTINTTTGTATPIGPTGVQEIQGMTIRPSTKEIYGAFATLTNTTLYRISSGFGDALPVTTIPIGNVRAIAFTRGDTLYGATTSGALYRINLPSGDTTYIGTAPGIAYSSLAFSPTTGILWASVRPNVIARDNIYSVNISNGDTALIGSTGLRVITPHIVFHPSGTLYALIGVATQPNNLYLLDTLTAVARLVSSMNVVGLLSLAMRTDTVATSVEERAVAEVPTSYGLRQNYPNPFNPATTIEFQIPRSNRVRLEIFNLLGRSVATLVNEEKAAGTYLVTFDGAGLSSGMYLYRLTAGKFVETRKLLILR